MLLALCLMVSLVRDRDCRGGNGGKINRLTEEGSDDVYGVEGTGLLGLGELTERDAQALGSRKMVELFLSSRRRRIEGSEGDSCGGGGNGGAFL